MAHNQNNNGNNQGGFMNYYAGVLGDNNGVLGDNADILGDLPLNNVDILGDLEDSSIEEEGDGSAFLDSFDLQEEFKKKRYGKKDELNRDTMSYRIYHIKMSSFEDYYKNSNYLTQGKTEYDYYLFYYDEDSNFYIQIRYETAKNLTLKSMGECEFLRPITSSDLIDIMNKNQLEDVKVGNQIFINLRKGPLITQFNTKFNQQLFQYCRLKGISLW